MNKQAKIIINDKDYYCDMEVLKLIERLQEKLEVSQTNEETYRLEMQDITKILGLDEHTIFDEVKKYATNLQEENKRLKENPLRGMFANITDDELLIDMGYTNKENEELKQRIDKAIELLEKENYHCPMSLTVEKAYIIEVEKINNVLSILRGEE